jgi:predicted nucleic acid-binding protein
MRTYVLDASALMTFFENRAGADKVEKLLVDAADGGRPLAMSVVNWGEVYYAIWRTHGEKAATAKLQAIAQLPIQVVDADMDLARQAASLKAQYSLPYADCFAAALAQARKGTVVTSDKDFERAGTALKILWV